jgi:hypothetical protein
VVSSNSAAWGGGGGYISTLNNCAITGNSSGYLGGGLHVCTLNSCTLIGNSAMWGGGSSGSTLNNCTLTGNLAGTAGGAGNSTLNNCIAFYNNATEGANYFGSPDLPLVLNYSCTTPMPTNGIGNLTNAPLFVDLSGGNLRLQSNSPCVNAGNNDFVTTSVDLDGNPRISASVVDIGAFESAFTRPMDVGQLILLVENSNLGAKTKHALLATLAAASASFERGNIISGSNQLAAFENKVRAQVARVDPAFANQLIEATHEIIESAKRHY